MKKLTLGVKFNSRKFDEYLKTTTNLHHKAAQEVLFLEVSCQFWAENELKLQTSFKNSKTKAIKHLCAHLLCKYAKTCSAASFNSLTICH